MRIHPRLLAAILLLGTRLALPDAQAADTSAADLQAQRRAALEAAAKGSEAAEKLAADLKKVLKVKQSEENKAHGEQLKVMRQQVTEAARKCTDLDKLTAALDCLSGDFEIDYSVE